MGMVGTVGAAVVVGIDSLLLWQAQSKSDNVSSKIMNMFFCLLFMFYLLEVLDSPDSINRQHYKYIELLTVSQQYLYQILWYRNRL